MRTWIGAAVCALGVGIGPAAASEATPLAFARKPTATRTGGGTRIDFEVTRPTDVAVFIEEAEGRVARHLAAGVLGPNAPAPFKPHSLAQTLVWDGLADYGRPAGAGPFKVRVALGLGAAFDRVIQREPNSLQNVMGLACGPDGTLYVLDTTGGAVWHGETILAYDRDGRYRHTVLPFSAGLGMDRVKAFDVFEVAGRPTPLVHSERLDLYPGPKSPRKTAMAVTADGKALLRLTGGGRHNPTQHVTAVGVDGAAPWDDPCGPPLITKATPPEKDGKYRGGFTVRPCLAVSSDGKWVYFGGIMGNAYREGSEHPAVFRAPLPARAPGEPFFGDLLKAGKDLTHLGGAPRGLATDGKGHLLIADFANDRLVVVNERDATCVGELAVQKPDSVAVDPATGAVYVTGLPPKGGVTLTKCAGWQDAKPVDSINLRHDGNPTYPWVMALDGSARPPVIWLGGDGGTLLRIDDLGQKFGGPKQVSTPSAGTGAYLDVTVDRVRREVYARCGTGNTWWYRYNESADTLEKVAIPERSGGGQGVCLVPAPDGNLYGLKWPFNFFKWDRTGKPLRWEAWHYPTEYLNKAGQVTPLRPGPKHSLFVPVSETEMPHTLGVRWSDGHLFVLQPGRPGDRPPKALHEYLPSGKQVTTDPIIWKVSDAALGPRFDAAGNIYIAEYVKPVDQPYPPEFVKHFGPIRLLKDRPGGAQAMTANMYGSIVKFSPKGGMVHVPEKDAIGREPYEGRPRLDPSLKTVDLACFTGGTLKPIQVTGAEWVHPGASHVGLYPCTCENVTFDVDEFGRVFFPDLNLFRVRVIDTNGNAITHFGAYGNAESAGPASAVPDPPIAFAWLVGVGATDRYVYAGDSLNRRLLRARLAYAAEETVSVPAQ